MKDVINKAVALGLGIGISSKAQAAKLATSIEKKLNASGKESKAFVAEAIRKGEKARKDLEAQITSLAKSILPVSRKEFDSLKAKIDKGRRKK